MKTIYKILIATVVGLLAAWICYQLFNLDTVVTSVVSVLLTSAVYGLCDKMNAKK